jgi:O6-methylguanine-DNA--protein-cysteine methyltransferase
MRETLYSYHREGLDKMSEKMRPARQAIMNSLKNFEQVHRVKPLAYNTQQFFLAKSDEIVNLFTEADPPERNQVYEVVSQVDPGNLAKYDKMQKGK